MINDSQNLFSGTVAAATGILTGQSLTGTSLVGSENNVNTITLNWVFGQPLFVWLNVTAVGGTCTAFSVVLQCDDSTSFPSATALATWAVTPAAAGMYILGIAPNLIPTGEKYIRLAYTMTGTSPTKTVFAGIAPYVQTA
jgi:hypothetical protein